MDTPGDYRELGFSGTEGAGVAGNGSLVISRVSRDHAGFYLCQASNGIGPGLSKLIRLTVHGKIFTQHDTSYSQEGGYLCQPANLGFRPRPARSEILQFRGRISPPIHTYVQGERLYRRRAGEEGCLQSVYRENSHIALKTSLRAFRRVVYAAIHLRLLGRS